MSTAEFYKTGATGNLHTAAGEDNPFPVVLRGPTGTASTMGVPTDGAGATNGLYASSQNMLRSGTLWYAQRGNEDTAALVTHTAASAGVQSADQKNFNGRGAKVVVDITAIGGTTPTLTVDIQGKDAASGKYYTILTSAAFNATGTYVLEVYPGGANAANVKSSSILPRTWRVVTTIGGTGPAVTATVGASVIL